MKTSAPLLAPLLSLLLALAGHPAWAESEDALPPDRLHEIDARIEALDARRAGISVTGPKTATLVGLGALVAGGILFGVGWASCHDTNEYVDGFCGGPQSGIALASTGGALVIAGSVTAFVGGIVWQVRADRRKSIDAERESLIKERSGLGAALSRLQLQSAVRGDTHFVTLGARF